MTAQTSRQPPIRKRSFQLFEIIVSLALIALCLLPLLKPLSSMRKADMEYLEEIQLQQASQSAFCTVKELLYTHQTYSWEALLQGVHGELNETFSIVVDKDKMRPYRCSYTILSRFNTKKPSLTKDAMVVDITLNLSSEERIRTFERTLYLEKEKA